MTLTCNSTINWYFFVNLRGYFYKDGLSKSISKEEAKDIWFKLSCLIDDTILAKHIGFLNELKAYEES